jgi:hypothetical protein
MLRISKLTDYATVILARLAAEPTHRFTAGQLASQTRLAAPTVSKLLKQLHRRGLVNSTRGLHGGYLLARPAIEINAGLAAGKSRHPALAAGDHAAGVGGPVEWRQPAIGARPRHSAGIGQYRGAQPEA